MTNCQHEDCKRDAVGTVVWVAEELPRDYCQKHITDCKNRISRASGTGGIGMSESGNDNTEQLECDVSDCEKPALVRVFPTHGQTDHSALRCRKCLQYDVDRGWFREWRDKITQRESEENDD